MKLGRVRCESSSLVDQVVVETWIGEHFLFYQISANRIKREPKDNTLSEQFKSQIRYSRQCEPF